MKNEQQEQPAWLKEAMRELPTELDPSRDLWPEVALNIAHSSRNTWRNTAVAASVLFSVMAGGASVYWYQQQQIAHAEVISVRLQQLSAPYEFARVSYEQQWQQIKQHYDPETVAIIEKNLATIKAARDELAKALDKNPDDVVVQQLLRQSLAQEISTYEQLQQKKPEII